MVDTVAIQIPKPKVKDGSSFTATAFFRAAGAASMPTNVHYRIQNLTTCETVQDWTSVSAAGNVSIAVTAANNAIRSACNRFEKLELTVDADHDLSTQVRETAVWEVENVRGF